MKNQTMKRTKAAGGVVVNKNGEVLVVNQHGLAWSLPKGHIDLNENSLEAAKREIYEESGIRDLTFIKELGEYQRYRINLQGGDDKSELKDIIIFLFQTPEMNLQPIDPENPEARWVSRDEVSNLLTHRKDREFFLKIMKEI